MKEMKRTEDPMLEGVISFPQGALVNYPDSYSPAIKVFMKDPSELS